jgi:pyruvate formate lyase activating enzyme
MRIGGFTRLSSVDWPGQLAATVFCQGCPWDCAFCHNPHLLVGEPGSASTHTPLDGSAPLWSEVMRFLSRRVGLLDGVVFSGGEPLQQTHLPEALREVRALGLKTALHTGGSFPDRFAKALPEVDWVGFDVKAPFSRYESITRAAGSGALARTSLLALLESGVAFEVRTTVHPSLLNDDGLLELADELRDLGIKRWVLQRFRAEGSRLDAVTHVPTVSPHALDAVRQRLELVELRDFDD